MTRLVTTVTLGDVDGLLIGAMLSIIGSVHHCEIREAEPNNSQVSLAFRRRYCSKMDQPGETGRIKHRQAAGDVEARGIEGVDQAFL